MISFQNEAINVKDLYAMNERMHHRGPDDDQVWVKQPVGFGFRRLAIIDTEGAIQPLKNEDGTLRLVCNGEIYNYRSLRLDLEAKGHQFATNGDAEVIVHLYEEYGSDFVKELRGMFAFLLWDDENEVLVAGRDAFGIKPLLYTRDGERMLFSSEASSLATVMESDVQVNHKSLSHYLTLQYVPGVETMATGINSLKPGHLMHVQRDGSVSIESYWQPCTQKETASYTSEQWKERIRTVMESSVSLHMQSDVPIGSFLSSGIDSTIITALMRELGPLHTFSVGFEGEQNECVVARKTAKMLGTHHHERIIGEEEFFQLAEEVIQKLDEPVADPSAVPLYALCEMASREVTVVLSGEGADELFAGYRIYQEPTALSKVDWLPGVMKRSVQKVLSHLPAFYGKNYLTRAMTPIEQRFVGNAKIFTDDKEIILNKRLFHHKIEDLLAPYYEQVTHLNPVRQMQYIDQNFWLPGDILAKADRMSMAHSLELRVPFLDKEVYDVAKTIPTELLVTKQTTKALLREAFADLVPDHVLHRPKLGFPVPLRDWLRGSRGEQCLERIYRAGVGDYVNLTYAKQLVEEHQASLADHSRKIWVLYVFAVWYEQNIGVRQSDVSVEQFV